MQIGALAAHGCRTLQPTPVAILKGKPEPIATWYVDAIQMELVGSDKITVPPMVSGELRQAR